MTDPLSAILARWTDEPSQEMLSEMLPLADEAVETVKAWWAHHTNGLVLNPDLSAVINQAAFSALQRFAKQQALSDIAQLGEMVRARDEVLREIADMEGRVAQITLGLVNDLLAPTTRSPER